jgi:SAM-dependent methyltransferase
MTKDVRITVREHYTHAAQGGGCCGDGASSCGCSSGATAVEQSVAIGYNAAQLATIPTESVLGLGCGNPTAIASLQAGQTVVDLGSGGGIDCFLASRMVGPAGHVIGVDMTPAMLDRARTAATRGGYTNVEFRMGEIEHLPVADATVDAVISNCVINLSPDKKQVFREAHRVLREGGRLMVSDIVTRGELPEEIRNDAALYAGCVAGALPEEDYLNSIREAGFREVRVVEERSGDLGGTDGTPGLEGRVFSVNVLAVK